MVKIWKLRYNMYFLHLVVQTHTFRTVVIESPFATSVSAIQPPMFANTAMVNHGKTHNKPDSVRLNFNT